MTRSSLPIAIFVALLLVAGAAVAFLLTREAEEPIVEPGTPSAAPTPETTPAPAPTPETAAPEPAKPAATTRESKEEPRARELDLRARVAAGEIPGVEDIRQDEPKSSFGFSINPAELIPPEKREELEKAKREEE